MNNIRTFTDNIFSSKSDSFFAHHYAKFGAISQCVFLHIYSVYSLYLLFFNILDLEPLCSGDGVQNLLRYASGSIHIFPVNYPSHYVKCVLLAILGCLNVKVLADQLIIRQNTYG